MKAPVASFVQQWAKKYVGELHYTSSDRSNSESDNLKEIVSQAGRERTAKKLIQSLKFISAQAWSKTETLLQTAVWRQQINSELINPWEIAADCFQIYQKVLKFYAHPSNSRQLASVVGLFDRSHELYVKALQTYNEKVVPDRLTNVIGDDLAALQKKYTANDARLKGFVSIQLHYTSQILLEHLSPLEKILIGAYFKFIDDHFYMPLQRSYEAAAKLDYNSPALSAVQQLLPHRTEIAKKVCQRVNQLYPHYRSLNGYLTEPAVRISSIRDVEMFQVYLWVCTLEGNIASIQQELFPLCVMLYPVLGVKWELLRQMLYLLGQEIRSRLNSEQADSFMPYFQALWEMFSPEVLGNDIQELAASRRRG